MWMSIVMCSLAVGLWVHAFATHAPYVWVNFQVMLLIMGLYHLWRSAYPPPPGV